MALINTTTTGVLGTTIFGDGAGDLTVQKDGVTVNKVTTAPLFSCYMTNGSANQSVSTDAWTKVKIDTKEYDTNSNFDTTNYRFTPTVAGYYQVNGGVMLRNGGSSAIKIVGLYKNGSLWKQGMQIYFTGNYYIAQDLFTVSSLVYLNGSTDYVELYGYVNSSSSPAFQYGSTNTWFNGFLARAA